MYRKRQPDPRRGVVLLVVLLAVVMLSLASYQYSARMTSEYQASRAALRLAQARALADSGVHYAAAALASPDALSNVLNSNPYNNPSAFQNRGSDDSGPGKFSLIAPIDPSDPNYASGQANYRFGVIDESGKINLNALVKLDKTGNTASQVLQLLPNMTPDIADAIIDWIDADDDPRPNGAESQYYGSLSPPYQPKNGPLDSLEELLLVKGVTPQLLFGNDRNRNGIIDPDEDDGSDPTSKLGWSAYLTVYSREQDVDSQGNARIYLNDRDLDTLASKLGNALQNDDLVNYILAARTYGLTTSGSGNSGGAGGGPNAPKSATTTPTGKTSTTVTVTPKGGAAASAPAPAPAAPAGGGGGASSGGKLSRNNINTKSGQSSRISSLYDLIDSSVTIPGSNGSPGTTYNSPLSTKSPDSLTQLLPLLLDKTTVNKPGTVIAPRINVATAPVAVLNTLTGINQSITSDVIQAIQTSRPSLSSTDAIDPIYQTPAWLITQANIKPQMMKTLEKYITSRSQVFRVQSVGYFPGGGPVARVEAVIDTNAGMPRVVLRRDLTELGPGFDPSSLGGGSGQ